MKAISRYFLLHSLTVTYLEASEQMHVNKQGRHISIHIVLSFSHHLYILSLRLDQSRFSFFHSVAAVYAPFMFWPR